MYGGICRTVGSKRGSQVNQLRGLVVIGPGCPLQHSTKQSGKEKGGSWSQLESRPTPSGGRSSQRRPAREHDWRTACYMVWPLLCQECCSGVLEKTPLAGYLSARKCIRVSSTEGVSRYPQGKAKRNYRDKTTLSR